MKIKKDGGVHLKKIPLTEKESLHRAYRNGPRRVIIRSATVETKKDNEFKKV